MYVLISYLKKYTFRKKKNKSEGEREKNEREKNELVHKENRKNTRSDFTIIIPFTSRPHLPARDCANRIDYANNFNFVLKI